VFFFFFHGFCESIGIFLTKWEIIQEDSLCLLTHQIITLVQKLDIESLNNSLDKLLIGVLEV